MSAHAPTAGRTLVTGWLTELAAEYRALPDDELLDALDFDERAVLDLAHEIAGDATGQRLLTVRRDAARAEFARRVEHRRAGQRRRSLGNAGLSSVDWAATAADVRARHGGIAELLTSTSAGTHLRRAGRSTARGDEWCGPCPDPACGGRDRFRVWSGPPGRYWCRQCRQTGSVIDAYQLAHPHATFREAVAALAGECGVILPEPKMVAQLASAPSTPGLNVTGRVITKPATVLHRPAGKRP